MKKIVTLSLVLIFALGIAFNIEAKIKLVKPSTRAVWHNNQGVKYLNVNNLTLAGLEFKTAIELSPDYIEAYNNLGIVAKRKGDLNAAEAYFKKAITLDKAYGVAYSHLAMVYLDLGNYSKALTYGKGAVEKSPTAPSTHYNLGMIYFAKTKKNPNKSYDKYSEKEFKIATELSPDMFEAHVALARLYKRTGRYELSAIRYRLAIQGHPTDPELWNELGQVYSAMGDNPKANNAFKKALSLSGVSVTASSSHMDLGVQHMNAREYKKATEEFKKAIKVDPKNEITHYRLGTAYLQLGNNKAAIASLKKALKLNPQFADAAYNLGLAYYNMNKVATAEKGWLEALQIDPDHSRSLYNLGMLYMDRGDLARAAQFLCKFARSAGLQHASEKENALKIIKSIGGKCPS